MNNIKTHLQEKGTKGGNQMYGIKIQKTTEPISNCNVCGAINFKKEHSSNKSVDTLTKIWIGNTTQQKITLCNDCLKELSKELNNYMTKTT